MVASWDESQLEEMGQFQPAGPLYSMDCSEGSVQHLHLPHCEIDTGEVNLEFNM